MRIEQRRIRNLSKLSVIKDGMKIRVVITKIEEKKSIMKKLGFSESLNVGETILPNEVGPVTRRNSRGYYIIHRDSPKEKHSRMIEWTYKQWSGRDDTVEVTDSKEIEYERYTRTFILPKGIEFTISEKDNEKILISPEFEFSNDEEEQRCLILAINILLESFGHCEIVDLENTPIFTPKVRRLNWEVLPKGKYPWHTQKNRIEPFFSKAKGKNRAVIEKRLEKINEYKPDFTSVGSAGFGCYLIHGFENKDLFILESIEVNNATYILKSNWENISMLTKAEILNNNLHEARIIHNKSWYDEIDNLLA